MALLDVDELAEAIRAVPRVAPADLAAVRWCDVGHAIGTVLDAAATAVLAGVSVPEDDLEEETDQ